MAFPTNKVIVKGVFRKLSDLANLLKFSLIQTCFVSTKCLPTEKRSISTKGLLTTKNYQLQKVSKLLKV